VIRSDGPREGTDRAIDSRGEQGRELLQQPLRRHSDSPEAWADWLTELYEASAFDQLVAELDRMPKTIAVDPRFAKPEGRIAQNARDWPGPVRAYRCTSALEPFDQGVLYRLGFMLRQAGESAEFG
jgi:hypothetical protein